MEDAYQDPYFEPEPKKRMSGWVIALIIIAVIVVIACLCAIGIIALLALTGPAVGNVFSTIIETVEATTPMP